MAMTVELQILILTTVVPYNHAHFQVFVTVFIRVQQQNYSSMSQKKIDVKSDHSLISYQVIFLTELHQQILSNNYQYVPAPCDVRSIPSRGLRPSSNCFDNPKSVILIFPQTAPSHIKIFPATEIKELLMMMSIMRGYAGRGFIMTYHHVKVMRT